jgi:predicted enzyme related to lactoylglutathione lyase
MAVIRDPSRAQVALWQSQGYSGARLVNEVGAWAWNELVTPDLDSAKAFYGQLFGWEAGEVPADIPRFSFSLNDYLIGGAHAPQPGEGEEARWTISFLVADADESAARVQELGGTVLLPIMETPIGKFSVVADPAGASFTVAAAPTFRGLDGS